MLEQIRKQMLENGYRPVQTSIPEVETFYKYFQNIYYCICIVDDRNSYLQGMGKMGYLLQCSKNLFTQSGYSCQILGVIVTSNVALSRSRAQGEGWLWYADTVSGQLLIYEDQPGEFLDARKCLEDAIANAVASGYWDYNKYSQEGYWKGDYRGYQQNKCKAYEQNKGSKKAVSIGRFQLTPINTIIIAINILVYLFLEIKGDTQDIYFLYEHGAMALHKILEEKDFLCMLTCVFVHSGFGHLFSNMLVLLYIGDNVERALGKWKYLILYFISAIGANILVAIYDYNMNHMFAVTVGASGAIFGVIGGLLYMVCKNKGRLEDMTSTQLYIFLILSLYHGFNAVSINDVSQMGSNIAHFGGLAIGFFTAIFLYRSSKKVK